MKGKLVLAAGIAIGGVVYQAARLGWADIDWLRALLIALLAFGVLLLIPRRWIDGRG